MSQKLTMSYKLIQNFQNLQTILIKGFATHEKSDKPLKFFISFDASAEGGSDEIFQLNYAYA